MWNSQIKSFLKFSTLTYDLLGHGKTNFEKENVTLDDFSNQLLSILDFLILYNFMRAIYILLDIYQLNSINASTCLLALSFSASKSYPPSRIETTLPLQNFFEVSNILFVIV